jgi:PBSX family phage terminase large subunit
MKWTHLPKYRNKRAIICDGSVRSGKTVSMIIGFIHWAMRFFNDKNFGICGKTVASACRNIITPLLSMPDIIDYYDEVTYRRSDSLLIIRSGEKTNRFYIFGGKDESSFALIQGITLAGVLFDEVALMPRSFVDQAIARTLSEPMRRYWFNCNPDSSEHWFYKEWICNTKGKKALHLHFTLHDNPTLLLSEIAEIESTWTGVFYERYILGLWVLAEGLVYPNFNKKLHIVPDTVPEPDSGEWFISCDYGTVNPCSFGLWHIDGSGHALRVREYYYDARKEGMSRTDEEHYAALVELAGELLPYIHAVIVDPSAASFITCIYRHGDFRVWKADNRVIDGIRDTAALLSLGYIHICESCKDIIREFGLYRWDDKHTDKDTVLKINDHAMDDMRYFVRGAMYQTLNDLRLSEEVKK